MHSGFCCGKNRRILAITSIELAEIFRRTQMCRTTISQNLQTIMKQSVLQLGKEKQASTSIEFGICFCF